MKEKLLKYTKIISNIIIIAAGLAFFTLIVFGLKSCVLDHSKQLEAAMIWCKQKHFAYDNNPEAFIANNNRHHRGDDILFIENTTEERKNSLPTNFFVRNDGTAECEIAYCLKFGLSWCHYDREKNDIILISD